MSNRGDRSVSSQGNAGQDVGLVAHETPPPAVPDHERRQDELGGRPAVAFTLPGDEHRARSGAVFVGGDSTLEVLQTLQTETLAHVLQQVRAAALEAEHVALVERGDPGLRGVRLTEDSAHELRQRAL